ncbi:MAG TPA: UDP-N-acetylglucosamine 2-epimerase [Burkholderiales bacterium]
MTTRRRVCVVTGSRAEYGLLRWVIDGLSRASGIELQLAVTGMHLEAEYGDTVAAIEADGYPIAARVAMRLESDTPAGIARSMALGLAGFGDAFERLRPELLVILGDRFEILAAAQAALVANIPIAHIAGGDLTEGSFDDAIRHALTKMAHLHFVTNAASGRRVVQMGEDPERVHVVGSPGLDNLKRLKLLERDALERELGAKLRQRNLVITFHPVTLAPQSSGAQLEELLQALDALGESYGLFFTLPNADTGGRALRQRIESFVATHANARAFASLGQLRYLSLMRLADAVVGNSSSGLYEAPALHKPSVNIGERQQGRLRAASVIDVEPARAAIGAAIARALTLDTRATRTPYGDGDAAQRIVEVIAAIGDPARLLRKRFHEAP